MAQRCLLFRVGTCPVQVLHGFPGSKDRADPHQPGVEDRRESLVGVFILFPRRLFDMRKKSSAGNSDHEEYLDNDLITRWSVELHGPVNGSAPTPYQR